MGPPQRPQLPLLAAQYLKPPALPGDTYLLVLPFLVVPVVLAMNVVAWIFGSKGLTLSIYELWNFALPISAMVGLAALVLTVPVMILKELSGDSVTPKQAVPSVPSVSARSPD